MKFYKFFLLTLLFIFFISLAKVLLLNYFPDFSSYYYGPKAVINDGNPYLGGKDFFTPFVYPPLVLLFFYPFSLMPFVVAGKIWTILSIVFLLISIYRLIKLNNYAFFSYLTFIILTLSFAYFPTKFTLGMGQINLLIFLLVTFFLFFYFKEKKYLSGIILGLAISLKIFPILLIPYLILMKKWKVLFASFISIICFFILTLIFIKPDINIYFFKEVLPGLITGWKNSYYNQSLSGFLSRILENDVFYQILRIIVPLFLITISFLTIIAKKNNKDRTNIEISLILTLNLIINSFSWQHHFVWMLIPLILTLFYILKHKLNRIYYFILGFCYVLTATNMRNPEIFPILLQSHVFYGGFILFILNLYLLFKNK